MISGKQLIKFLTKFGYSVVRQKGSHIRLEKTTPVGIHKITLPFHDEIARGTLSDILSSVSLWNGISKDELIGML